MKQYIGKDTLLARIKKLKMDIGNIFNEYDEGFWEGRTTAFDDVICELDTLEVKEIEGPASTSYVVTRCEEHSDYVEKVFFDEDKAQEYCDQFNGNENEYARHITRVEVTL